MLYEIGGEEYANLFEYSFSPSGLFLIYVASDWNGEPEAYRYDVQAGEHTRLTDNLYYLEHYACIDDAGNWALALIETDSSFSKVICNGDVLMDDQVSSRSLCLTEDYLFFAVYRQPQKNSKLFAYDLKAGELTCVGEFPGGTDGVTAVGNTVLLEAYDLSKDQSIVLALDIGTMEQTRLTDGTGTSLLNTAGESPCVEQVTGSDNAVYLMNACYFLEHYQASEPFNGATDSGGRISWNAAYRLHGMIELYEKIGDPDVREKISRAVDRLVMSRRAAAAASGRATDAFLFPTRTYSLDEHQELMLLVNTGMIYWATLRAANAGLLNEETYQELLRMAEQAYDYYEEDWNAVDECYHFRKGTPYHVDGVILPFNQQNAFACMLIELYKATGEEKYKERCTALAENFAKEITLTEDGRSVWYYWPRVFYAGWEEEDDISTNTPQRAAMTEGVAYEDISHSAINAAFIKAYSDAFGYDVFSEEVVEGVYRTFDACFQDDVIYGTVEPTDEKLHTSECLPALWSMIFAEGEDPQGYGQLALTTSRYTVIQFDGQNQPLIGAALTDPSLGGELTVRRFTWNGTETIPTDDLKVPYEEILEYVHRYNQFDREIYGNR